VNNGIKQAGEAASNGINTVFHKGDWIPDNLLPRYRDRFQEAAEIYKSGYDKLPKGFQLPKDLARELADLLNQGKSVEEAVDEMPELEDYNNNHD
jgi:hypothetical protein